MYVRLTTIILMILVAACDRGQEVQKSLLIPVRIQKVVVHGDNQGVRYSANVIPVTQVNLAFKVNGYIDSIYQTRNSEGVLRDIARGEKVSKDQVLAHIKEDEYLDKVNEAKGNLGVAEAGWIKAQQDFQRAGTLYQEKSMTAPDYDSAQQEYTSARDNVGIARAQLDTAKQNLEYCSLKSPLNGVMLSRNIETGTLITPGVTAFSVADMSAVKVLFAVPDVMLKNISLGDSLDVKTRSLAKREFSGKVTSIAPSADQQTRVFEIELTIPNPKGELKDNMVAALKVEKLPVKNETLLKIPIDAVVRNQQNPSGYAVYIVEQQSDGVYARLRDIQLGKVHGNRIDVLSGLASGDQVIVLGINTVWDGSQVNIVN